MSNSRQGRRDSAPVRHSAYDEYEEDAVRHGARPRSTKNNEKKHKNKKSRRRISRIFLIVFILIIFAIGGAGLGALIGILRSTEMLNVSDVMPQAYTSIIYDDKGNEVDKLHREENREYVSIEDIPLHMQQAVIAIEDERFYKHGGIDMRGILRAIVENIKKGSFSQGASTITQQLIKNEVLNKEKSISRKVKEQYLALNLEDTLEEQLGSKEKAKKYILELYLNTIALSHGLNGVEAAAQYYFGKHASELTIAESACIASITNSPNEYAPDSQPENNKKRQTLVLNKMLELEFITKRQYDEAMAEDIYSNLVSTNRQEESKAANHNYFVEAMIDQLAEDLQSTLHYTEKQAYNMIYSGGLKIHTTMDTNVQQILDETFTDDSMFPPSDGTLDVTYLISVVDKNNPDDDTNQSHYERRATVTSETEVDAFVESVKAELLDDTHEMVLDKLTVARSLQAAMVVMDQNNGSVKGLVGGRGEKPGDSVFNRATQAFRQQGSAMKPLASYAPAIDKGLLMPGSIIEDEPVTYGSWSPKNWNNKFIGPTTVREGIKNSMNILAIKAFMEVGADVSFTYMENMGLENLVEEDKAATTALGGLTKGVTVLEMTDAYATIANGGTHYDPIYYTVVYDHEGKVLLDNRNNQGDRALKETTAYLLTDMMKDVVRSGTGTAAALKGMTVAGKTGTTNDTKDLTFYGYTPYYTAGIWMGYDNSKIMNIKGSPHLQIWRSVMNRIHEGLANKDFTRPSGIVTSSVCGVTGKQPSSLCSQDYYGLGSTHTDLVASGFKGGDGVCTAHQQFKICQETGMLAGPNCKAMTVVLAVEGDKILSKPATLPDGKLDINLSQTCNIDHKVEEEPEEPEEQTGDSTATDIEQGTHTNGGTNSGTSPNTGTNTGTNTGETPAPPPTTNETTEEPNFGIQ